VASEDKNLPVDVNVLAGQFAGKQVEVKGVFNAVIPPGQTVHSYSGKRATPTAGFVYVMRGSGLFIFNGSTYSMQPGVVVHGGPQMELTMITHESELTYVLVRYTLEEEAPRHSDVRSYTNEHFMLHTGVSPQLAEWLRQLRESFYTSGNVARIRTNSLFNLVLYETLSCCLNRNNEAGYAKIEQVKSFIHDRYMEQLSLHKIAERQEMNVKSLSYLFHKYVGMGPIDYLIQHRMKRARELLAITHCTVKQVAASVGYEDALYFSRLYKKYYGHSPSQSQ
jgi:AraC-like DNA-binding protein